MMVQLFSTTCRLKNKKPPLLLGDYAIPIGASASAPHGGNMHLHLVETTRNPRLYDAEQLLAKEALTYYRSFWPRLRRV